MSLTSVFYALSKCQGNLKGRQSMKKAKFLLLIFCCLFFDLSLWAEKIGENLLYKEDVMNPTLMPESIISDEVTNFWKKNYNKNLKGQ